MSFESIFDQVRAVGLGFVLGLLTAAWCHAVWLHFHPHSVRYWGTWYTDPRVLVGGGIVLAIAWLGMILIA